MKNPECPAPGTWKKTAPGPASLLRGLAVYISFSGGCRPQRLLEPRGTGLEPRGTGLALCCRFPLQAGAAGLSGSALQRALLAAQTDPLLLTSGSAQPRPNFGSDCLESVHTGKSCSQQTPRMLGKSPSSTRARDHCFLRNFLSIYFCISY